MSARGEGICVGIRMRPLNEREKNSGQDKIFQVDRNTVSQIYHGQPVENQVYNYDKVFDESASTREVYSHIAKDIVTGVLNGINGTIFAYGQTSSGKTHTMLGSDDQPGVLNMAAHDIFTHIGNHPNRDFILRASFVEIYNENIRDLLSTRTASSDGFVAIREDPRRGVYVESEERMMSTYEEINALLKEGISRRAVEATAMNDTSSRSHTIFRLVIESRESNRNGYEGDGAVLVATLNLVDLAGSESVKHTGAMGQRAKEGGKINQSLLSLSRVIHALSTPGAHVGYRDSKLTRLLQPSLSGNAKMSIVCCITPADRYLEETRSTLQFASRAKLVETHATVNEVLDDAAQIKRLKKEVEVLRAATSEEAVAKFRQLEEHARALEEQLRIKEAAMEQMRVHYEASAESKQDTVPCDSTDAFAGSSDRRGSKRHRAQSEESEDAEEEAPRSLASIKNTLAMMHQRRASAAGPPAMVLAAVESAAAGPAPIPVAAPVAPVPAKVEAPAAPAVPFNPMTLGLRNMLMKELDSKLGARKSKVEAAPVPVAPVEMDTTPAVDTSAVAALTEENASLRAELAQAREAMAAMESSHSEIATQHEAEMQRLQEEIASAAEELQARAAEAEDVQSKLSASEELIASLQAQLAEAAVAQCVEMTVATGTVEAETAKLAEQAGRIAELESEVAALKESLDASETETLGLLEQLEQSQEGLDAGLTQKMAEKDAQVAAAMETVSALNTEVARVQTVLKGALFETSETASALVAAQEARSALQAECDAHLSTIAALQAGRAADAEKIAGLELSATESAENVAAMEAKLSEVIDQGLLAEEHLEAARDSATELQGLLAVSEERVSELTTELTQAHSATAQAESNLSHAQQEFARSQQCLAASTEKINELTDELSSAQSAVTEAEAKLAQAQEYLSAAEAKIEELNSALQESTESAAAAASTVQEIAPETMQALESAQSTIATLEEQVSSLQSEVQRTSQLLASVSDELSQAQEEKTALLQKVETLEAEAAEAATNSKANNDIISEMEGSLVESLNEQQNLENEIGALHEKMDALQADKDSVAEELAAAVAKLAAAVEEIQGVKTQAAEEVAAVQSQLATVEEELAKATKPASPTLSGAGVARLNEFEMNQESLDASRKDMERMVGNIRSELGNKEAEVSRLMAALEEAQERAMIAEQRITTADNAFDPAGDEQAKKRLGQLQTTVDLLNGEKDSLLMKLQGAERELKAQEGSAAIAIEKLERDCVAWEAQTAKLQQEIAQAARMQENANEVRRRLEDVTAQRDQHQLRADAAAARVAVLEELVDQLKSAAAQPAEEGAVDPVLHAEKMQLQQDLAEVAGRLKKSQEATAQIREQWEQAETDRVALEEQLALLQEEKALLSHDLEAALDNINTLTEALEEANESAEAAANASAAAASAISTGIAMVPLEADASEELAALQGELEQLKADKEILALEGEVQRDELTQKIAGLEEQLGEAQMQLSESLEKVAALTEEAERMKQAVASSAAELQQSSGVCKYQAEQIAELLAQVETAQMQAKELGVQESAQVSQLLSVKAALEEKIASLEGDLVSLRVELEQRVSAAAEELEMAASSANEEINALHQEVDAKTEEVAAASAEVARLQGVVETLQEEVAEIQTRCELQKSTIAQLEAEVQDHHESSASAGMTETISAELAAVKLQLQSAREELRTANDHCAANEDMVTSLQEKLQEKELRVAHLETCKLTKVQMDRIKVIKEERKKYYDDNKTLKAQLKQLMVKFDELKQSAKQLSESRASGVVGGGPTTDYIISDLRVQLVTTTQQLSQAQDEVKLLKSKLKECAVQLKEYEADHSGIVAVLEKYGVDTRGLIPLEHSVDEDTSAIHADIADAVAQLGEKLDLAKAAVSRREISKSEKMAELEGKLAQQAADLEESMALRVTLEKRLEVLKASAKSAREGSATATLEIEALQAKVKELKDELSTAHKRVVSSTEVVSSEVQALEEENIELLKENKELRLQVSRLKANPAAASAPIAPAPVAAASVFSPAPKAAASASSGALSGSKRAFGTDISNTAPTSTVKASQGDVAKPTAAGMSQSEPDDAVKAKSRRTRVKAKAMVDESMKPQDEAGECKQS